MTALNPSGQIPRCLLLAQTAVSTKDGRLQLTVYGQEPTRLTSITELKDKK